MPLPQREDLFLTEPLLLEDSSTTVDDIVVVVVVDVEGRQRRQDDSSDDYDYYPEEEDDGNNGLDNDNGIIITTTTNDASSSPDSTPSSSPSSSSSSSTVSVSFNILEFIKLELYEMYMLGLPLAISFFCRMGMASTDSAFVGHIHDEGSSYGPEIYLSAAVLSDMCIKCPYYTTISI